MARAVTLTLLIFVASVYAQQSAATPNCGEAGEGACPAAAGYSGNPSEGADVVSHSYEDDELASNLLEQAQISLKAMAERAATAERLVLQRETEIAALKAALQARESPQEIARLEAALARADQRAQEANERGREGGVDTLYVHSRASLTKGFKLKALISFMLKDPGAGAPGGGGARRGAFGSDVQGAAADGVTTTDGKGGAS